MRKFVLACLILIIFFANQVQVSETIVHESIGNIESQHLMSDMPSILDVNSNPIIITSNVEFAEQVVSNSWSGSGNSTHPYIIRDLIIASNETYRSLTITDTTVHFEIRNCSFFSEPETADLGDIEVLIDDVDYGTIENSTIWNGGIRFQYCRYSLLKSSTIMWHAELRECDFTNITDSRFLGSWSDLLTINGGTECVIANNFFEGIVNLGIGYHTVTDNVFTDGWIRFSIPFWMDWTEYTNIVKDNTRYGKELAIYYNLTAETVDASNLAGVTIALCENMHFENGDFTAPIEILSSNSCRVSYSVLNMNASISILNSDSTLFDHNTVDTYNSPIYVDLSPNTIFEFNDIEITTPSNPNTLIYFSYSASIHVRNNSIIVSAPHESSIYTAIFGCDEQTSFTGNYIECYDVLIDSCPMICDNIFHSSVAVESYSFESTIRGNIFENSKYEGLYLEDCNNVTITSNKFLNNSEHGIRLQDCSNCKIFLNEIGWNGNENSYSDRGTNNTWDDGVSIGNAWSDYSGEGVYSIHGPSNEVDRYPSLLLPTTTVTSLVYISDIILYLIIFGVSIVAVIAIIVIVKKFR